MFNGIYLTVFSIYLISVLYLAELSSDKFECAFVCKLDTIREIPKNVIAFGACFIPPQNRKSCSALVCDLLKMLKVFAAHKIQQSMI